MDSRPPRTYVCYPRIPPSSPARRLRAPHPTSHWHLPTPASTPASPPASVARKYIPIVSFARYPSLSLSAIAFSLARAFSLVVFLPPSVDLGLLYCCCLGTFCHFFWARLSLSLFPSMYTLTHDTCIFCLCFSTMYNPIDAGTLPSLPVRA